MKVSCPVCNRIGILQKRGNSVRVVHYQWVDGKRVFTQHKIPNTMVTVVTEDSFNLVSVLQESSFSRQKKVGRAVCN